MYGELYSVPKQRMICAVGGDAHIAPRVEQRSSQCRGAAQLPAWDDVDIGLCGSVYPAG